jgi:hypothetical protein
MLIWPHEIGRSMSGEEKIETKTPKFKVLIGPLSVDETMILAKHGSSGISVYLKPVVNVNNGLNLYARANPDALDRVRHELATSAGVPSGAIKCIGFIGNNDDVDMLEQAIENANREIFPSTLYLEQHFIRALGYMAARGNSKARTLLSQKLILASHWNISKKWRESPDESKVPEFEVPLMPAYFLSGEALKALALAGPEDLAVRRQAMLDSIIETDTRNVFAKDSELSMEGLQTARESFHQAVSEPVYELPYLDIYAWE